MYVYNPHANLAEMILALILLVAVPAVPITAVVVWLRVLSVGLRPTRHHHRTTQETR